MPFPLTHLPSYKHQFHLSKTLGSQVLNCHLLGGYYIYRKNLAFRTYKNNFETFFSKSLVCFPVPRLSINLIV